jgi:hypothetical protein
MSLSKIKLSSLKNPKTLLSLLLQLTIVLLSVVYPLMYPNRANAAVTEGFVRFDRLATGAVLSGTACLKSNATTQTKTEIVFPATWTIDQTASHWTVTVTNLPYDPNSIATQASAWPGINTATGVSGLVVTFPTTAFTAGTFYCFNFTGQGGGGTTSVVGTAGNGQTGELKTQGGSPYTDDMVYATSVVAAAGEQISVTASVSATMTFTLSGNTAALGTLVTSGAPSAATAITESVTTNARNGWVSWIKGTQASGLHSTIASANISSPGSFDGTPETLAAQAGYVVSAAKNTCASCTIDAEYLYSDANHGGHIDTTYHETAYHYGLEAAAETVDLVVRAKAAATTPAATDYADTLVVTAAGSF